MLDLNTEGQLLFDEPLAKYTTWRVGGKAKILYKPKSVDDLVHTLKQIPNDMPVVWLGLGSNTLIRDGGFNGLVVLTQGALKNVSNDDGIINVDVGVSCASMARFCARNNFAEAEFWAGIPGTMGGALRMNAGCFGGETWTHLIDVVTVNRQGQLKTKTKDDFIVHYREIKGLLADEWFVSARFKLPKGNKDDSLKKIKILLEQRANTQPTGDFTCGSVFKNPEGDHAARLIETCGLKGKHIGGATVSTKHANFITNNGQAGASHIEDLICLVQSMVDEKMGVKLHREVKIIGEKGSQDA